MNSKRYQLLSSCSGQSLVETALLLPFMLALALNVINFGYFFVIAINLAAAPRSGALYSILGASTPASAQGSFRGLPPAVASGCTGSWPASCDVSDLTYGDLTGA